MGVMIDDLQNALDARELGELLRGARACPEARREYANMTPAQALARADEGDLIWFLQRVLGVPVPPGRCHGGPGCWVCRDENWINDLTPDEMRRYIREALAIA